MDLMNSTLRNLNDRTNTIYEALEAIDKKHSRLEKEFLNNIDFIHELRDRAQELISRQKQIEKGFKDFDADSLVGNFTSKSKNYSGVSNVEISASRSLPKQQPLRESYSNRDESTEEKNSQTLSDKYDSDNDSTQNKPKTSPKSNYHDEEEDDIEEKEDIEKEKSTYIDDADEYTPDEDRRSEDLSNEYNVKEIDNIEPNNRNFDDSEEERLREEEEEERLWEEEQKRKEEERRLRKLQEENDFEDEYASREGVNSDEDKEEEFLDEDQEEEMRIREKIERMKQEELDLMQQEE